MDTEIPAGAVPLAEAAATLGITPDTLRMRMKRGQYEGHKIGYKWFVVLPDDSAPTTASESQTTDRDSQKTASDSLTESLVSMLRDEISHLHSQLSEKDKQIGELHVLLQTAQQNEQRLLSAGLGVSPQPTEPPRDGDRDDRTVDEARPAPASPRREREGLLQRIGRAFRGE